MAPKSDSDGLLERLFPAFARLPLEGLYLHGDVAPLPGRGRPFVYTNFVTSLDGRIAVERPQGGIGVPQSTANPRDWRLLLELAAPADAVVVSGRLVRELAQGEAQAPPPFSAGAPPDLAAYRAERGLPPQPALVIVSAGLDLPDGGLERLTGRRLLVATSDEAADTQRASALQGQGVEVMATGAGTVAGQGLVTALAERGLERIYSVAGPRVLHTLLRAGVLDRLYLTSVLRILAGTDYASLVQGPRLEGPYDFSLTALYRDPHGPDGVTQLLQVYDRAS